jgi:hypothetical protein
MIAVIAEFNTNANNEWVYDERIAADEELPNAIYGPFTDVDSASKYVEDFMPDETDLYDVYVVDEEFPEGTPINNPSEYPDGWKHLAGDPSALLSLIEGPVPNLL